MLKSNIKIISGFLIGLLNNIVDQSFKSKTSPMLRHIPNPINTGRLKRNIRVQAARNGMMNNGLFFFV